MPVIYIIDDDTSFRRALERLLRAAGYAVEAHADARSYLARALPEGAGCLILDLAMPEMDGLALQARLAQDTRLLPVVFLSGAAGIPDTVRAMKMGAVDFLTKPVDEEILLAAVRTALARCESLLQAHSRVAALSTREREVMALVVAGLRNKQIAARLDISEKTVKVHRAHIMEKTGAGSVPELVRLATRE